MKSHREIFRSSAIIGGSSALKIGIGIIRVKVLALLLGPAGIGLLGIYVSILGVATTISGCGMSSSGVRQLALSSDNDEVLSEVRRALLLANLLLGCFGMAVVWVARDPIAQILFDNSISSGDVGWLGLGVLFSLLASSQTTLLQGLRRINDLARVNIFSALGSSVVGVFFVYLLGREGVVWFVVSTPVASILVASYFTKRLPAHSASFDGQKIKTQCQSMISFGVPVMIGGLINVGTQLFAFSVITSKLGIEASGYFQASWAISITYLGFVLGAMGTDYYPRLTALIHSPRQARQLVNEQCEMTLLLGGAVILAMITFAPIVITMLYSSEFEPAGEILRWQMLGSIMKLISLPMGFVVLASGRSMLFIYTQLVWNAVFMLCLFVFLDLLGPMALGFGFCVAYMASTANLWFVAYKLINFSPNRFVLYMGLFLLSTGGLVVYLSTFSFVLTFTVGTVVSITTAIFSLWQLDKLIDIRGALSSKFN